VRTAHSPVRTGTAVRGSDAGVTNPVADAAEQMFAAFRAPATCHQRRYTISNMVGC
jgi:hypothetical protein